jgi:hypothetical protein
MTPDDAILNTIKTDVEIIKRDIITVQAFSNKLEDVIDKMADVSNSITKMLVVHENKLQNHDQQIDGLKSSIYERKTDFDKHVDMLHRRISDMKDDNHKEREKYHKEVIAALKDIADSNRALDQRVSKLEQWKWYVLGVSGIVGFLLSQIPWEIFIG